MSTDGKMIAYAVQNASETGVWVADFPRGSHAWSLAKVEGSVSEIEWSSDGRELLYVSAAAAASTLHLVQISDGKDVMAYSLSQIADAHWNPHGETVVFSGSLGRGWAVYIADVREHRVDQVTFSGADSSSSWSADGRSVFFSRAGEGGSSIWKLQIGGTAVRVTDLPGLNIRPTENSEGKLAFLSNSSGRWEIWMAQNGSVEDVTGLASRFFGPATIESSSALRWSPDGQMLLVQGFGSREESTIYLIDLNGTVVAPTNANLPLEQQPFAMTVYHTPTIVAAAQNSTLTLVPASWRSDGSSFLTVASGSQSYLLIVQVTEPQAAINPYG